MLTRTSRNIVYISKCIMYEDKKLTQVSQAETLTMEVGGASVFTSHASYM